MFEIINKKVGTVEFFNERIRKDELINEKVWERLIIL